MIKGIIRQLSPYFVVQYWMNRKNRNFADFNDLWANYKGPIPSPPIKNTFKYIASIQGFGHSGSGAVVDLLREIPKATVLGGVDLTGTKSHQQDNFPEFDLIRVAGGLFEIEKLLGSENFFINEALIKRFIALVNDSAFLHSLDKNGSQILLLNFMHKIIDLSFSNADGKHFELYPKHILYFLKNISKEEYRSHCQELLGGLFSLVGGASSHLLVLDQLFSDIEFDINRNKQYVPNLKTIMVCRDPRDVFMTGLNLKEYWIPYADVTKFVKWYDISLKNFPRIDPDVLNLRFEDLVLHYDTERKKILNFLDLEINDHTNMKTNFAPEMSIKNIGLWKGRKDCETQIAYISDHLAKWCYNT
jgi:hypothetical protein